jgi:hypothetical protein
MKKHKSQIGYGLADGCLESNSRSRREQSRRRVKVAISQVWAAEGAARQEFRNHDSCTVEKWPNGVVLRSAPPEVGIPCDEPEEVEGSDGLKDKAAPIKDGCPLPQRRECLTFAPSDEGD